MALSPIPKITRIEMDWTDDGARCFSTREGVHCPRCGTPITPNEEHRCGNMAPLIPAPPKLRAKRKAVK